jgi:uncharacterized protein (DUF1778 family)
MADPRVRFELRLTPDEQARWQGAAEADGRSLASLVRRAVELYLTAQSTEPVKKVSSGP